MRTETLIKFTDQILHNIGYKGNSVYNPDTGGFTVLRGGVAAYEVIPNAVREFNVHSITPPLRPGLSAPRELVGTSTTLAEAARLIIFVVLVSAMDDTEARLMDEENKSFPPEHTVLCAKCNNLVSVENMYDLTTCKSCAPNV